MKKYLAVLFILLCACQGRTKTTATAQVSTADTVCAAAQMGGVDDKAIEDADAAAMLSSPQCYNDIRFENWTHEDWLDNDYFRALRACIDDWLAGKLDDEFLTECFGELEPYRFAFKDKFVIANVQPHTLGGLNAYITFLDAPDYIFEAWVYSEIREAKVAGYHVRYIGITDAETGWTKEMILALLKEHPEHKLW